MTSSRFTLGDVVTVSSQYQDTGSELLNVHCIVSAIDALDDAWQITCTLPDETQCVCNESELTLVQN